jgi:hypothetical protein
VRVGWDLHSLRPLSWLLDAAAEAGRLVVLTADHGHVVDGGIGVSRPLRGADGGERWRVSPPPPGAGEVEIAGPRVLAGDGRVVMAFDERLYFGAKKHGYHGGAVPQEVLVPVVVLARQLPAGWRWAPLNPPVWWTGDAPPEQLTPLVAARVETPALATASGRRPTVTLGQSSLFDEAAPAAPSAPTSASAASAASALSSPAAPETVSAPTGGEAVAGWVRALLSSPAFQAQRKRVKVPRPLGDEVIAGVLTAVHDAGGTAAMAAVARRIGQPTDATRFVVTQVQRLVNLDGAPVLSTTADASLVLDTRLLAAQFEVAVP